VRRWPRLSLALVPKSSSPAAGTSARGLLSAALGYNDIDILLAVLAGVTLASALAAGAAIIWQRHAHSSTGRALVGMFSRAQHLRCRRPHQPDAAQPGAPRRRRHSPGP
jgi:hypothetical protein